MTTLFLAHSIYHILYSLSMISTRRYSLSYLVFSSNNKDASLLLRKLMERNNEKDIKVIFIPPATHHKSSLTEEALLELSKIKRLDIDELITFNEHNLLAVHLGQFFHKKNVKVALAQDGMKAYATISKWALKDCFLTTLNYYLFCKLNNVSYSPIFINMKYGKSYYIDKLYVSHKSSFVNPYNKEIEQVDLDTKVLKSYALLTEEVKLEHHTPTIFFVSSLIKYDSETINIETKILNHLSHSYPHHQLLLKVHPRADAKVITNYTLQLNKWKVINNAIPAEVYINELHQCTLLSAFSGVALFNKKPENSVSKYWVYPLYEDKIKSLQYTKLRIPDRSIHLIKDWKEFSDLFPLSHIINR